MATPPPPPGYQLIQPERKVSFDWVGYVPPEVRDATQSYSDAVDAPESPDQPPEGYELLGPGMGHRVADPLQEAQQRDAMQRAAVPNRPGEDFVRSNVAGALGAGIGASQLAAHLNIPERIMGAGLSAAGYPSPVDQIDAMAAQYNSEMANDPSMHTPAGNAGRLIGGTLATAPLGVASIPAKGAGLLGALWRGAVAGGSVAATNPVSGDFAPEKGKQVGLGMLIGAGVPAVGRAGMWAAEHAYGGNSLAQLSNASGYFANKTPFAKEGEDLANRTGVRMTPAQVSGSKVGTALENMSRQSIFSADKAFAADQKVAGDTIRYIDKLMDNVSKSPASDAVVGTQIQSVTRGAVEKIANQRELVAAQQYGAIDKALGGKPFVKPTNALREADAIIAEYGKIPTPEAARIVKQAQELKAKLAAGYTFKEAQITRGYYGKGARGAANVFDDLAPDINRTIATRFFKAWSNDIEQSADALAGRGPGLVPANTIGLSDAIKAANKNYRDYSDLIKATEAHPIARLFGDNVKAGDIVEFDKIAPEVVVDRLGKMKPSELHMVRNFMERNDPQTWQQYKRLVIENALDSASVLPGSYGANTVPFNAAGFVRALSGNKPEKIKQLNAIFSASEMNEINDALNVARRLGDKFGANHSGTGPYNEAMGFLDSLKQRGMQGVASTGGHVLGLRKIANVMFNADGRRALIQLSKLPPQSRQAASLLGFVTSLWAGQQSNEAPKNRGTAHP